MRRIKRMLAQQGLRKVIALQRLITAIAMHCSLVVNLVHVQAETFADPGRHAKSCLDTDCGYHDRVTRAGRRILHPPHQLAVHRVHVQARGRGAAFGFGVQSLATTAMCEDVNEIHFRVHRPAIMPSP